jgi:hypothetical protein
MSARDGPARDLVLMDFWRDPNRRLPHDRVVHTAVVRARGKQP